MNFFLLHFLPGTIVLGIVFVAKNSLTDDMLTALQSLPGDIQVSAYLLKSDKIPKTNFELSHRQKIQCKKNRP